MSRAEPIPPTDPQDEEHSATHSSKPDWLVGAEESTRRDAEEVKTSEASGRRPRLALAERLSKSEASTGGAQDSPSPSEAPAEGHAEAPAGDPAGAGVWKAAASSVPRLRQQPAASTEPETTEAFAGFAQDTMMAKSTPGAGARGAADLLDAGPGSDEFTMPLDKEPPFWEQWLEQLRALPRPVAIGLGAVLVLGVAVYAFWPRGGQGASLAQIRQHPEAFEGRSVRVNGRAGEAFAVGGSFVFNLYQGRDTIVVYSRTRPPVLNEKVKVSGTVSIGYLDGVPRVALLESPAAP